MAPAPSVRISTCRPGRLPDRCPLRWEGNCASACRATAMWSAAVLEPAFPGRSMHRQGLPAAVRPVIDECPQRMEPEPAFNVGAADSFSECAVTRVASMSMISGAAASAAWSGACSPASAHTRARAAARAASIALSAAGASAASASIVRDTVGSEATRPYTPGSAAQQPDVGQAVPAQRQRHRQVQDDLARSWTASGLRHGDSAADSAASRPAAGHGVDQQHPTGLTHRRGPARVDLDAGIEPATLLHLEGAPRTARICPSTRHILAGQEPRHPRRARSWPRLVAAVARPRERLGRGDVSGRRPGRLTPVAPLIPARPSEGECSRLRRRRQWPGTAGG